MKLRKGKTKSILESSIDSALLAVEIYNKPRTTFRSEGYITMMIIAWTRLFHAHFNNVIGSKYYYKKNNRYEVVDGEKKAWELVTCIKKFNNLSLNNSELLNNSIVANLEFFIKLRNKIEHRHIEHREVDTHIFGECQSLLYNYETMLIKLFGAEYSINEALVYSLQFSQIRTSTQEKANKSILSKNVSEIIEYVKKYRNRLDEDTYNSQEYSIKLIHVPKISNTNRADVAMTFVKWDSLNEDDKESFEQLDALIKDKIVKVEAVNVGKLKPTDVIERVNVAFNEQKITGNLHPVLYKLFRIRPPNKAEDPFDTNNEFCLFDELHHDYVYQDSWVNYLIHFFQTTNFEAKELRRMLADGQILEIEDFRIQ